MLFRRKAGKIKNAGKILYLRLLDSLLTEINLHIQKSTPGGIRTPDTRYRKPLLYPLSYECAYSYASSFPAYIVDLPGSFLFRLNNDAIIPHLLENVKFLCEISSILFKTAGKPVISTNRKTVFLPVIMIYIF